MDASVGVVGRGPAVAAIEAALGDVDVTPASIEPSDAPDVDLVIAVSTPGDVALQRVNETREGRWIAVELGGLGGRALADVDVGISILGDRACYDCLRARVASLHDGSSGDSEIEVATARFAGAHAGRLAIQVLAGETVHDRIVEIPHAERRLLPAPGCECASDRDYAPRRTHEDVDLAETTARAEDAVDDRLGIVAEVGETASFPAPYYLALLCETDEFGDGSANRHAAGVAAGWDAAFVKAIGEGLERYAAAIYDESSFERVPAVERANAVPPSSFVLPTDGFESPDAEEPIPWVQGADLHDGTTASLPAEFVHFPPSERRHKPSITTGLGLGTSGVGALLSGLYETIERDATSIAWYSTYEPLAVSIGDDGFETLARRARSEDLTVTPLLLTQDVDVPVIAVAVHREGSWPNFAVGSAADLDPVAAATDALCEALQNWMELRRMGPERAAEETSAIGRYADRPREAEAFLETGGSIDATDLSSEADLAGEAELDAVLDRLAESDLAAYASRLTTRDLEVLGFEAVRVLVPAAQPRFLGERFFGERARAIPRELGYRARLDRPPGPYP